MKQLIQLTIMVSFLVNGMAESNVADGPNFIDAQNLDFAAYPGYEATPTPAPSRDSIAMVVARVSSNPLSGLQVLEQKSSPALSWLGPDGKPLSFQSNVEVEEFLRTAEIISIERIGEGLNNFLKVLLEKDGIRMHAIFRDVHVERSQMPLSDGKISFFFRDDAIFECAAYELAKLLGLDTVPPVVERKIQRTEGNLQA